MGLVFMASGLRPKTTRDPSSQEGLDHLGQFSKSRGSSKDPARGPNLEKDPLKLP